MAREHIFSPPTLHHALAAWATLFLNVQSSSFLYASGPLHLLLFPLIGFSSFSSSVANAFSLFRCHLLRQACSDTPTLATRVYLNDPSHLSVNFLIAFVTVCRCLVYWSVFPQ